MTDNPYDSPILDTTAYVKEPSSGPVKRPIGLVILVVFVVITAIVVVGVGVLMFATIAANQAAASVFGVPIIAIGGFMIGIGGLILVSAVGLWMGKIWGWWLVGVGYSLSALWNGLFLMFIIGMSTLGQIPGGAPGEVYTKYGVRAVIAGLIVSYLFKDNVLTFFALHNQSKGKLFGILCGITFLLFVVLFGIGMSLQLLIMSNV